MSVVVIVYRNQVDTDLLRAHALARKLTMDEPVTAIVKNWLNSVGAPEEYAD